MKKLLLTTFICTIALFACHTMAVAQLKVDASGSLSVNSYTGNWGRANWTKIYSQYAASYHLYNTYYGGDVFYVRGDGYVWTRNGWLTASDSTLKTNILDVKSALDKVMGLRGVTYNRKFYADTTSIAEHFALGQNNSSPELSTSKHLILEPTEYGLLAQEVAQIIPEAVKTMQDSTLAVSYSSLIPVLIEAIKEQQTQIEFLQGMMADHAFELQSLSDCCELGVSKKLGNPTSPTITGEEFPNLYQNTPNPFNSNTTIEYYIPSGTTSAALYIFGVQGNLILSKQIETTGQDNFVISNGTLTPGMYLYTLFVDDEEIATKRMILTND